MWITKYAALAAFCVALIPARAQGSDSPAEGRRLLIGVRLQAYASELFKTATATSSTTKPVADYTYTGSVAGSKAAFGPAVEYRLRKNFSLIAEMHVHEARYGQTIEIRNGRKDPTATNDPRNVDTISESTGANYWEFPFMAQYTRGQFYFGGGMQYRHIGQVRTGTEYVYADGATDYNEVPARRNQSNQFGIVIGGGFFLVDARHVRIKPEVRYVRWQGVAFEGASYRSASNQVEAGIGFLF